MSEAPRGEQQQQADARKTLVAAFYAFRPLNAHQRESLLADLPTLARDGDVVGSVLVAKEGVNGTISGPQDLSLIHI